MIAVVTGRTKSRLVLALLAGVLFLGISAGSAWAAAAHASESASPEAASPASNNLIRPPPFIDRNVVFLTCATGASLGALITGLPPVMGWIPYAGWPTQVTSLMLRMGMGCYYGTIIGVAATGTYSTLHFIRDTWNSMF